MSNLTSTPRRLLAWWAVLLCAGLFVGVALVPKDDRERPPEFSGALWRAQERGSPLMVYITREDRSSSGTELERLVTHYYTRYELVARRVADGSVVARERLAEVEGARDTHVPAIVGITGDVLWLWRDSLEARRLPDLSVQLTVSSQASVDVLPSEATSFRVAPDSQALLARGRDARFYRIDAASRTLAVLDPATLPPAGASQRVEDRFDALQAPGRARTLTQPNWVMQRSFLTSTRLWYALLSESERAAVSRFPSGMDMPSGEVARSLYKVPYRLDDRGQPEIDPAALEAVGSERIIQGGFLVRSAGRIWDVADPSSSLLFAKARLGGDEPWEVVRLTRDGRVLWRTSTGLPHPEMLLDLGTHLAVVGDVAGRSAGERLARLTWIDQGSGVRRTLALESDEVR